MRNIKAIVTALLIMAALSAVLAMPVEAVNGVSSAWGGSYGSYPGSSFGLYPGTGWGGWNPGGWGWPQDNWWTRPGWGNWYPGTGGGWGGWFSDCYSRCISQGYGSTYCSQVCPV
ncbi:hypothetical protein [Methanocella sp. MCL-LM]|uniref:hypothetical protein n=1 Tax=Methanocella sp. MCL-LM TaxID=3412035 RepID=UPI003C77E2E2